MKNLITFLGIAAVLVVALTANNVAAQSPQPTPTAVTPLVTVTPMPRFQNPQVAPLQQGWGMGMHGGMMGGRMGGMMGMRGGGHHGTQMMNGGFFGMNYESMMYGVTPMHDDVARYMGMTTQDLYNQMAAGMSMVQIAAQRGITEQQLMDTMMAGRRAAYDQAIKAGRMTQAQADAMLQNMNSNLKNMVNGQGFGSSGWGMMWDYQPNP